MEAQAISISKQNSLGLLMARMQCSDLYLQKTSLCLSMDVCALVGRSVSQDIDCKPQASGKKKVYL